MKFTTLLVDADILLHRACVVASTSVAFDDELTWRIDVRQAGGWIRQELAKYRRRLGASRVLIALGDRKANFRKELCPTYKANRATSPKPPGFAELEARLRAHARVYQEPRLEGDDVLGLLATRQPEGKVIVSIDKDLLQVPGWHYNPDTDQLGHVTEEEGRRFHLAQTLTGDPVDGYPGCPGIGRKRAPLLLAGEGDSPPFSWARVTAAYARVGQTEEQALLQARLAFVLREGWYDKKTQEVKPWTPT